MKCRACTNSLSPFLSLGKMPLVNHFLKKGELSKEKRFDLTVAFCPHCYLVQLTKIVPPKQLFSNYLYFSSTSSSFLEHCADNTDHLTHKLKLNKGSLVVEIASNDGAQLQYFKKAGMQILGIDPAKNIAKLANKKGIPTIADFFSHSLAKKLQQQLKREADLIYGANVLAHVPKNIDFARGVKNILASKGTAVFEFPYLAGLLEGKFDTIYHEHVFYYSLIALKNIFARVGLVIYDVEHTAVQGGSLMIFISHPGAFKINRRVAQLIRKEKQLRLDKITTYYKIGNTVQQLKEQVTNALDKLRQAGKTIAAYSAPAKGNILLNYFGISGHLNFIVDKAKSKQGLYTPGTHLLVHSLDKIYQARPDYMLILCWNIAGEVIQQLKDYQDTGGKFIIPIPKLKIV